MKKITILFSFLLSAFASFSQVFVGSDGKLHSASTGGAIGNLNEASFSTDTTNFKQGWAKLGSVVYYYDGYWKAFSSTGGSNSDSLKQILSRNNLAPNNSIFTQGSNGTNINSITGGATFGFAPQNPFVTVVPDTVLYYGTSITIRAGTSNDQWAYVDRHAEMIGVAALDSGISGSRLIQNSVGDNSFQDRVRFIPSKRAGIRGLVAEYTTNDCLQFKTVAQVRAAWYDVIPRVLAKGYDSTNFTIIGCALIDVDNYTHRALANQFDTCTANVCKELGIKYVSPITLLNAYGGSKNISSDSLHPANRGHQLYAIGLNSIWNTQQASNVRLYGDATLTGKIKFNQLNNDVLSIASDYGVIMDSKQLYPGFKQYSIYRDNSNNLMAFLGFNANGDSTFRIRNATGKEIELSGGIVNMADGLRINSVGVIRNTNGAGYEFLNSTQSGFQYLQGQGFQTPTGTSGQFLKADGQAQSDPTMAGTMIFPNAAMRGNVYANRVEFLNTAQNNYADIMVNSIIRNGGTGTGFWKDNGTLDYTSYLSTSTATSTYAPKIAPAFTGTLTNRDSAIFSGITKFDVQTQFNKAYIRGSTNNIEAIDSNTSSYTNFKGIGFIKYGGTSSQLLAADGSVVTAGTGVTISGGTISTTTKLPYTVGGVSYTGLTTGSAIFSYTNGNADSSYMITASLNITAISVNVIETRVLYTDETNTARTLIFYGMGTTSAGLTTTGVSNYAPIAEIRAKANTNIDVVTVLTTSAGTITYNASASLIKIR